MARDKGQVRRVLQILSLEDQETLALLHDPPRMEELLRRQEALAAGKATELASDLVAPLAETNLTRQAFPGLRILPAALAELADLPATVRDTLLQTHLPALLAAPQDSLALTQLFQGLRVSICPMDRMDYRIVFEADPQDTGMTILMVGHWESLEERLQEN
jgi:hypothetical protein